jgi:hypothetical protein
MGRAPNVSCIDQDLELTNSTQDWFIFFGGAAFTLLCFWLIYHYLG